MKRVISVVCLCCLLLSLASLLPAPALAQSTPRVDIVLMYPKVSGLATDVFTFDIELMNFTGAARNFDLTTEAPSQWSVYITPGYETTKKISAIRMEALDDDPDKIVYGEGIQVTVTPPTHEIVEPGEYPITLEVSSGDIKASTELVAVITAYYNLSLDPVETVYSTKAQAGKGKWYPVYVTNLGTAPITGIDFLTDKAEGWKVGVDIVGIESLDPGDTREVGLTIIPPSKSIPGDYYIAFWVIGSEYAESIDIRVTVETPTLWGWLGLVIVILIVAGLAYLYVAFRRR